jgi:murein DD-endopeptidase MepM/ murein hydrolase activator NlpD
MAPGHPLRRAVAGLAAAVLAVTLVGVAAPTEAETIAEVKVQLEKYEEEQAALSVELNTVQQRLTNAAIQLAATQTAIDQRQAAIDQMQDEVIQLALLQYQNQGMNSAWIVFGSEDAAALLRDLTTTQWMATTTNDTLQNYQLERSSLAELEQVQSRTLEEIEADEARVEELMTAAEDKVTQTQALLNRLTAQEQAKLAAERAKANGSSTGVVNNPDMGSLIPSGSLMRPVNGRVNSPYGWRTSPISGASELHDGVDYEAKCGTPVMASANGVVLRVEWYYGYGNRVVIDHGTIGGHHIVTSYNHLQSSAVSPGQTVAQGQIVAYSGATGQVTGCHLHFCVYVDLAQPYGKGNADAEQMY